MMTKNGWKKYDSKNPPLDQCWFVLASPEMDCDVDDYGQAIGHYTGKTQYRVVLGLVEWMPDELDGREYVSVYEPYAQQGDDEYPVMYMEFKRPEFDTNVDLEF